MLNPATDWDFLAIALSVVAVAYLVGSLSPSYVLVRRRLGQDIRQLGDGNAGAENVSRLIGLKPAIVVAIIDISKGLAVVLLARGLAPASQADYPMAGSLSGDGFGNGLILAAGVAVVVGHSWSLYLRGAGGRGAATAVGALCGIVTLPALLVALPALGLMCLHRSTTWGLASFFAGTVTATATLGYLHLFGYTPAWTLYAVALPALVGVIHYYSMRRQLPDADALPEE